MDLEVVFTELGQFGKYQTLQYALLTIPLLASAFEESHTSSRPARSTTASAFQEISYIFTSSEVDYRLEHTSLLFQYYVSSSASARPCSTRCSPYLS
ncbi:hypothetical protein J6590_067059 [Homalodisca vitripennis]|nr:hypothetical protein J6590_067059 [Homalodisca vitripennis]